MARALNRTEQSPTGYEGGQEGKLRHMGQAQRSLGLPSQWKVRPFVTPAGWLGPFLVPAPQSTRDGRNLRPQSLCSPQVLPCPHRPTQLLTAPSSALSQSLSLPLFQGGVQLPAPRRNQSGPSDPQPGVGTETAACPGCGCAGLIASACPGGWLGFVDCKTRILRCQAGVRERVCPEGEPSVPSAPPFIRSGLLVVCRSLGHW